MRSLMNIILSVYDTESYEIRKKATYMIKSLPLLMVYLFLSMFISPFLVSYGRREIIIGFLMMLTILLLMSLVYKKYIELAVNLLILTGLARGLILVNDTIGLHFYSFIFVVMIVTAVVYIEKYQLYLICSIFNGLLFYRVFLRSSSNLSIQTEDLLTIYGGVTLTIGTIFLIQMIEQEIEKGQLLTKASETDALTNLPNRRRFEEIFIKRFGGCEKCLMILDLDHFKKINDTYGHQIGDKVLIETASILKYSLRHSDEVFRWGGEEFVILLDGVSEELGCAVADRIRESVEAYSFVNNINVTISIGMLHIGTGSSVELLTNYLRRADRALYRAKALGRNQVILDHKFRLMPVVIEKTEDEIIENETTDLMTGIKGNSEGYDESNQVFNRWKDDI